MTRPWTDAELMVLPEDGFKRELVDGEIHLSPAGFLHGRVIIALALKVGAFVETGNLGALADSSTGVWMPSGNLRVPDLLFIARERLPDPRVKGFLRVVPDLVVEVLSSGDSERAILDKVGEYLAAGVRLVWVIDPQARRAAEHRSLTNVRDVGEAEDLRGDDVLPGFRCRLGDVLG